MILRILTLRRALVLAALPLVSLPAAAQTLVEPDTTAACRWTPACSAPGATLRMVEVAREGSGRTAKVTVSPRVAGLPAGTPLTFWMRRLGEPARWIATGYALDSAGAVVCADRALHAALASSAGDGWCPAPLDSLTLGIGGTMQGEPFAFAISTPDGRSSAFALVFPRPSSASAAGCGSLDGQLLDAEAKAVSILGHGFAPSTRVTTESRSGRETVPGEVTTDSAGRFAAIVMPGTRGGRGGEASFTVRTPSCEVTLTYPWGRAAR